ncbi:putative apyrase 6 [Platanthera zijinensis]|uniref:Apyrase 6 n=1 Tax=Platanthera zijinensis TaxID=2320716 RepID=A0AAP0B694_9ASPA
MGERREIESSGRARRRSLIAGACRSEMLLDEMAELTGPFAGTLEYVVLMGIFIPFADRCSYKNCGIGSAFVPKLHGKLIATENFFHTSKFFGLGPSSFLSDLILAGEQFCEEDWSELKRKYIAVEEEDLLRYCFSSSYIVALLHDSLGIAMNDTRVMFANQVGEVPLDWALGAFIMQKTAEAAIHPDWNAVIILAILSHLRSIFVLASFITFLGWFALNRRRPQLK